MHAGASNPMGATFDLFRRILGAAMDVSDEKYDEQLKSYQLRIAFNELKLLYDGSVHFIDVENKPDFAKLLQSKWVEGFGKEYQNLIWTLKSLKRFILSRVHQLHTAREAGYSGFSSTTCSNNCQPGQLFLELSASKRALTSGGIRKVAFHLAKAALVSKEAIPVYIHGDELWRLDRGDLGESPVNPMRGDTYLILDEFWSIPDEQLHQIKMLKAKGVNIGLCIHDMLPITAPLLLNPGYATRFQTLFKIFIETVDFVVAVSRSTENDIKSYLLRSAKYSSAAPRLCHFTLGVDSGWNGNVSVRPDITSMFSKKPIFVSVGTLEPKKGYDIVLDAFDYLWSIGTEVGYVIFGKYGWNSYALRNRLFGHKRFGNGLWWIENASDTDLDFAYINGSALIQGSVAEGFGLPIIEAEKFNMPIVASDIDVFREINAQRCIYFKPFDSRDLAAKLSDLMIRGLSRDNDIPQTSRSWGRSLELLRASIGHRVPLGASRATN